MKKYRIVKRYLSGGPIPIYEVQRLGTIFWISFWYRIDVCFSEHEARRSVELHETPPEIIDYK